MDVRKIGAFISELRRNKDFTQAELAQLLAVSHQAVSKWERGESLPDIGLLPDLAKLLGITVDELLKGNISLEHTISPIQNESISGTLESSLQQNESISATMESSLQAEAASGEDSHVRDTEETPYDFDFSRTNISLTMSPESGEAASSTEEQPARQRLSLKQLSELAPFLSEEVLNTMIEQVEGEVNWTVLNTLAPFVGRATMERLVDQVIEGSIDARQIMNLAPFLGQDQLQRMVRHAEAGSLNWDIVQGLAPFLERSILSSLFQHILDRAPEPAKLAGLAPFLEEADLIRLIEQVDPSQLHPDYLSALAPFLPPASLGKLVLHFR